MVTVRENLYVCIVFFKDQILSSNLFPFLENWKKKRRREATVISNALNSRIKLVAFSSASNGIYAVFYAHGFRTLHAKKQ